MPVYLDDQQADLGDGPLGSILQSAQERLGKTGRVIIEVQLDGQAVSADALEQPERLDLTQSELRLYTADPRELAIETLEQVRDRLAAARQMQADAADLLQQDKASEALASVGQANEVWLQVHQAVSMAADAGRLDLNAFCIDGEPVSSYTADLIASLTTLRDTLTHHDTVALADALAYEWPGITDRWDRLAEAMADAIESKP